MSIWEGHMTKFRKKPIIVEAFQWTEDITPQWWRVVSNDFKINPATGSVFITTLEGIMEAKPRDFIVRGIKGELYPVKEPIFREIYEEIRMEKSFKIDMSIVALLIVPVLIPISILLSVFEAILKRGGSILVYAEKIN